VRRAKDHGSAFRANHSETPTVDIGRRVLSGSRFRHFGFNASISGEKRFATCQLPFDEIELAAAAASGHTGQGIPMDA
jgi:hypothetical protein